MMDVEATKLVPSGEVLVSSGRCRGMSESVGLFGA